MKERSRPRKSKIHHNFPFTGLFRCGECNSMITAQWATNRFGTKYRYYRCTKKKNCSQGYLREDKLVFQLKERLQKISLPDDWIEYMMKKSDEWEKEVKSRREALSGKSKSVSERYSKSSTI